MDLRNIGLLTLFFSATGVILAAIHYMFPKLLPRFGMFLSGLSIYHWIIVLLVIIVLVQQGYIVKLKGATS
ncbi:hypothetical protein V1503_25070 [Bacillus sp. SCS-151]|uniref:hypothetical protein n=1 Tax=Nanhaiella sioensis TaxID=3115293 RepID=UPI00397DD6E7